MAENNGYWTRWLVGILTTAIITALTMLGNNVIANEKASLSRDDEIKKELHDCVTKQTHVNQEILITLTKLSSDVEYIKKAVK